MSLGWLDALLVAISIAAGFFLLMPRIRDADAWLATVTPLASIIGSGFLIIAPLLAAVAGPRANIAIVLIVILSLGLGSAVRFAIAHQADEPDELDDANQWVAGFERLSDTALAFAYVISVAFYIRLMSGFVLTGFHALTPQNANILSTLILLFIGVFGALRGLRALERLEEYSVTVKLAIIVSLLVALGYTDVTDHELQPLAIPTGSLWDQLRVLGGMLLVIQGFETSKYLGDTYGPKLRARTMLWAQLIAGGIYIFFVSLSVPLMSQLDLSSPNETAIIDLSRQVSFILPLMLILAAVMSQFSAAIADTLGAGGVLSLELGKRLSAQRGYLIITLASVSLIWITDIFELVSYASRAFAFYYLLQTITAVRLAIIHESGVRRYAVCGGYGLLCAIMLAVVLFGRPIAS